MSDELREYENAEGRASAATFALFIPTVLLILWALTNAFVYFVTGHTVDVQLSAKRLFFGWLSLSVVLGLFTAFMWSIVPIKPKVPGETDKFEEDMEVLRRYGYGPR